MDTVPCLDSTPPYQVAYAQLNLLANDVKKVNAEDTLGVELIAFWLRFTIYHEIINNVYFISSLEVKTRKEEKKDEYHQRNDKVPKCAFDCESFGHICCRLGNGIQECRTKNNCPDPGK